ncbi:PP2C family protein-serine/threonine phosphatase [Amycolatopsis viridis]|uniref:Serine phosphatase RsbU (Regulator of sigma subunit) n=1 Tax=Amycolatopsis viridis TaxID=185678 RepID=A0ABX0SPI4_9PSEU|nr:SpoIIE family protein phosphatase [Amycolatopsis viridis]NIH78867.1 serine phosphatase RsbU (regulator of sigma subunit) [Amycolatopsis viridis]
MTEARPGETTEELVRELRETIARQERELRLHQSELEQTNAGLLALHAEVELQRQRSAFLDEVSRSVSASLRGREVVDALVTLIEREQVADSAAVWLVTTEPRALKRLPGPDDVPDSEVMRVVAKHQPHVEPKRLLLPLTVGPHLLGVLELHRDTEFTDEDVTFLTAVAARSAVGLRNASEYERERELAERLQHAMLPTLSTPDDLELCARYRPAATGVNIGGDWFDAFTRADGTIVLTVGDVTGHGLDAAVVMGKLQNALRAYTAEGHRPAEALRLAHHLLRGLDSTLFATAVVADLELATGRLRWASAGHLPMLISGADGIRFLERPNAPMLGVPFAFDIAEHEETITPGSDLLLYTDGLVERRSEVLDDGLARLTGAVGGIAGLPTDEAGDAILSEMLGRNEHDDDVCLLLCRWSARPGRAARHGARHVTASH